MPKKNKKVKKRIWAILSLVLIVQISAFGYMSYEITSLKSTVDKQELLLDSQGQLLNSSVGTINQMIKTDKQLIDLYKKLRDRLDGMWH